ncbi:hypothetical protein ZWY2020_011989 [Hordeum vulgare]|nr:hypothetical protein ZWY2020_011989 [Hordeum vulgare]
MVIGRKIKREIRGHAVTARRALDAASPYWSASADRTFVAASLDCRNQGAGRRLAHFFSARHTSNNRAKQR